MPKPKGKKNREPACKPGSVQPASAGLGSHSSGMSVTRHLKQPTRIQCGSHLQDSYLVLLQAGFTVPWTVTSHAVRSYRTLSPLPASCFSTEADKNTGLGGLLSAALSVGFRPPGITWRPTLWSPDFPPSILNKNEQRLPGQLAAANITCEIVNNQP